MVELHDFADQVDAVLRARAGLEAALRHLMMELHRAGYTYEEIDQLVKPLIWSCPVRQEVGHA